MRTASEVRNAAWTAIRYLINKHPKKYTIKLENDELVIYEKDNFGKLAIFKLHVVEGIPLNNLEVK